METPCIDEMVKTHYKELIKRFEMEQLPDSAYVLVPILSPMILFDLTVPMIDTCDPFFTAVAKQGPAIGKALMQSILRSMGWSWMNNSKR